MTIRKLTILETARSVPGVMTLRQAVNIALSQGGERTITFANILSGGVIHLNSPINIYHYDGPGSAIVSIQGLGANQLSIDGQSTLSTIFLYHRRRSGDLGY